MVYSLRKKLENGETTLQLIPADTVILASGQESVSLENLELLKEHGIKVSVIGGARLAGELDAKRAIYEGALLAYETDVRENSIL